MTIPPKPFVFVLMPFAKEFDNVYHLGIKAIAEEAGAYAERVDEQHHAGSILDRIVNQISKADVIVADMTTTNANVYYEVGYAHALGKIVVLLTQDIDDIPFDLKDRPHIPYDNVEQLREKLLPRLSWAIEESRAHQGKSVTCPIEVRVNSQRLTTDFQNPIEIEDCGPNVPHSLPIQLSNVSGVTIKGPITHVFLLLRSDAFVQPFEIVDGSPHVATSPPILVHDPPIEGQFVNRFRVQMDPISLPAYAVERLELHLTRIRADMGQLYYLPAVLEVLVADGVFRFPFTIKYIGAQPHVDRKI